MTWSVRSSLDDSGFDPSSGNGGRPRLIRAIQDIQNKLGLRIQKLRKNLPMKILFLLLGFYCATAFATVIGQTGDWDILSAALAVFVVEGIGALMYRASLPLLNNVRSLITMFNYWKAGLSLASSCCSMLLLNVSRIHHGKVLAQVIPVLYAQNGVARSDDVKVLKAYKCLPRVVQNDFQFLAAPNFALLQECGVPKSNIVLKLVRCLLFFAASHEKFTRTVEEEKKLRSWVSIR
ncbi:hypothetical protein COLO4_20772 [Corchorus olitorius]|uniref:Uncharacterized protein n=1 Tax=Corchorus olitorius TaxID=93759 RepID=A0A1R3IX15_9ROSI|nr:hypothetical protein COLO4_20772 [Corchorus olitorius]